MTRHKLERVLKRFRPTLDERRIEINDKRLRTIYECLVERIGKARVDELVELDADGSYDSTAVGVAQLWTVCNLPTSELDDEKDADSSGRDSVAAYMMASNVGRQVKAHPTKAYFV